MVKPMGVIFLWFFKKIIPRNSNQRDRDDSSAYQPDITPLQIVKRFKLWCYTVVAIAMYLLMRRLNGLKIRRIKRLARNQSATNF